MDTNHTPTSGADLSTEKLRETLKIIMLSLLSQESPTSQEKQDANMKEIENRLQSLHDGENFETKELKA